VNSHQLEELPLQSPPETEWPYSTSTSTAYSAAVPRITTDPGQYALASGNMLPPSTGASYSMQVPVPSRIQTFDMSNTPYTTTLPRQSLPVNYSSSGETVSSQYGLQPPRHGLPLQMSQGSTANYSQVEFPSQWTLSSHSRPLSSSHTFETDVPSSYQSTGMPYMQSSGLSYPTGAPESASVFPGLSPLASNLPYNGPSRTLPNPASVQSSLHGSCSSIQESDCGLDTYQQHLTNRNWRDAINASEGSNSTGSSSPSDNHRSSNVAYSNLTYSSHVGSNASVSTLPSGGISRRTSNEESYTTANSGAQANPHGNGYLPNLNSPYSMQSMHGSFGVQNDPVNSMTSAGTVLGSPVPPSIHHPQPQHSSPQDTASILRGTFDTKSEGPRKGSNSKPKVQKAHGKR